MITSKDIYSRITLEGFIMNHVNVCNDFKCPLHVYYSNYYIDNNVNPVEKALTGRATLTSYAKRLYKKALRKFYNCTTLRINYAFFIADSMQDPIKAQKQLRKTKLYNPKFDEDFIIFRYCKIIEEKITESKHQGEIGMDRVSLIAYDNYFRQCKKKMKEAAKLHIEFWSVLAK